MDARAGPSDGGAGQGGPAVGLLRVGTLSLCIPPLYPSVLEPTSASQRQGGRSHGRPELCVIIPTRARCDNRNVLLWMGEPEDHLVSRVSGSDVEMRPHEGCLMIALPRGWAPALWQPLGPLVVGSLWITPVDSIVDKRRQRGQFIPSSRLLAQVGRSRNGTSSDGLVENPLVLPPASGSRHAWNHIRGSPLPQI